LTIDRVGETVGSMAARRGYVMVLSPVDISA
jgi:hypothetical protein